MTPCSKYSHLNSTTFHRWAILKSKNTLCVQCSAVAGVGFSKILRPTAPPYKWEVHYRKSQVVHWQKNTFRINNLIMTGLYTLLEHQVHLMLYNHLGVFQDQLVTHSVFPSTEIVKKTYHLKKNTVTIQLQCIHAQHLAITINSKSNSPVDKSNTMIVYLTKWYREKQSRNLHCTTYSFSVGYEATRGSVIVRAVKYLGILPCEET